MTKKKEKKGLSPRMNSLSFCYASNAGEIYCHVGDVGEKF